MHDKPANEMSTVSIEQRLKSHEKAVAQRAIKLSQQQGARDQLRESLRVEEARRDAAIEEQRVASQGQLFLQAEVAERRSEAIKVLEEMGTSALRMVYGAGYRLQFLTFDEKRKGDGVNNFKMEIQIASPHEGGELVTGLIGERGGGVVETVDAAFREAALFYRGYKGPRFMDEAFKSMSNDSKLVSIAKYLQDSRRATGIQNVFATHKADVFGPYSDKILEVRNIDGVASVREIAVNDIPQQSEGF